MTLTVSVVVASYRRPDRLVVCLTALRTLRRSPDEVLVVVQEGDEVSRRAVAEMTANWPELRAETVHTPGSVAAYNRGLAAARGSIVAYVDDDAVPEPDWLERILVTFESDERIAAVGGRDVVVSGGRVHGAQQGNSDRWPTVGRIQWFGRMIANHHVGIGPPRDVDVLKGANMSFRRSAVAELGFDRRLRGHGAQVHSELSICLPLRKQGLRIVYDPAIVVLHYPAPRPAGDHRGLLDRPAMSAAAHNEALQILDYLGAIRRPVYGVWCFAMGSTDAPGLVVTARDLLRGRPAAWSRFAASQRGRAAAWRTLRIPRDGLRELPPTLLHRPELGWRRRPVIGALRMRPALAQHSAAEAALLMRYGARARTIVELGVAEGGSAAELRSVMDPDGRLYLIDPYEPGRLHVSTPRIVAARTVGAVRRGRVHWIARRSDDAARGWREEIDFLFIDADHSYERAASDWQLWTPFVRPGGHVALHDSAVFSGGWTDEQSGPVRLLKEIRAEDPAWTLVDQADSLSVMRRDGPGLRSEAGQPKLRILRIADVPGVQTAGMSGHLLSAGAEIERRGHSVTYWFHDSLMPSLRTSGLRRLIMPWLIAARALSAQCRGQRFDVVEIHEPLAAVYALLARLARPRLPACVVLSFGLTDRFWAAERAHLRAYGRKPPMRSRILVPLTLLAQARVAVCAADAVVVLSTADREHLVRRVGVSGERVSCAFTAPAELAREIRREPRSDVRLLFLGSWIERKGTLELVAAWRRLSRERPKVQLTLAGVGDAYAARAAMRDLARVEVIPTVGRDELTSLLAAHDVFVLPSWFEGMPLSMLEAAAAGLPCVVSAVCGNLDVFRPPDPQRDGALLVPANDAGALYRALLAVIDDPRLRCTLGERARERAREFTWGRNAEQTVDAFDAAVGRHRGLRS